MLQTGGHDVPDRLLVPETLYGREREIDALLAAFEQVVADGTPVLALVSGYAGIGKSSVVHELHKAIVPPRGLFAAGKFDQYHREIPYATIAQAFHTLIRQILGTSEAEVSRWRDALRQALEPNGRLIVNLIPALEFIIGPQPPVPDLPAPDAQHRFQTVFQRFLGAFARREHPLALFLDDLQWLDAATLALIERLFTGREVEHLLLVGAYRDNEVGPSHPLVRTLAAIRAAGARVHEVVLAPLGPDDLERLVADALHCDRMRAGPLARMLREKTGGNPFFASQFLTALADEGLLVFDRDAMDWTWDVARIRATQVADNVVDLLVSKVARLPTDTQEALQQFACLGNRADTATLCVAYEAPEPAVHAALWEAVRAGLVLRLTTGYTFLHDRVREAAYAVIPEQARATCHLRIGRLLAARLADAEREEAIFEIAHQFNRGAALIESYEEREQVANLNLIAGRRARNATAYVSALSYFAAGAELLAEEGWTRRHPLTFALELHRAECEFLTGDLAGADARLSTLSRRAATPVDRAAVTCLRLALYTTLDRPDRAIDVGLDYLDERHPHLGDEPSASRVTTTIGAALEQLDLAAVVETSQAASSEIVLDRLIERLMMVALEHAGADRGLLILLRGEGLEIEADATTAGHRVAVRRRQTAATQAELPVSILQYVVRTRESVILGDAPAQHPFSADPYLGQAHVRSILCLPLVKQAKTIGVLYLENSLAPHVFTPDRIQVLTLLASQAAISLENASLYAELQESEDRLRLAINAIPVIAGTASADGRADFINERWQEYTGAPADGGFGEAWTSVIHPDDLGGMVDAWRAALHTGTAFECQARMRNADGSFRWFVHRAVPLRDEHGTITKWYAIAHDIEDQRRAEERIRQDERELRLLVNFVPHLIGTLDVDGRVLHVNRAGLEYFGVALEELVESEDTRARIYHPEDLGVVRGMLARALSQGSAGEVEARLRRHDGQYRWHLIRYEPLHDEHGRIIRWYGTGTDIEDRKQTEERFRNENIALRDEIDEALMFEDIVGASPALRATLAHVAKVAPTESTVLITGETGTGKELIARAIHKRSHRSARAFVSVNCAVIPAPLIASELFGHEKGAFTGALQRRIGRFELAEGGTIFLDEIGELPADTQSALLRVLQEREFERVGGSRPLKANVRVIAATNRDLQEAIAAGTFRADLFYRLNVFPLAMPSLRERPTDIPLLVRYFVDRYSKNAGKRIRNVSRTSLDLLQSYPWPGNIRELQNVIERAIIVCETDTLTVDESWLLREPPRTTQTSPSLARRLIEERALIEAALAETKGRVSGPSGAAAKLRIPSSTLESKIRSLGIDKRRFKPVY